MPLPGISATEESHVLHSAIVANRKGDVEHPGERPGEQGFARPGRTDDQHVRFVLTLA